MKRLSLAHPALSAFLIRFAESHAINAAAILADWPSNQKKPAQATVYRWFQQPTRMSKHDAAILLELMYGSGIGGNPRQPCKLAWEKYRASAGYMQERSGVFDYECRSHGIIKEWNINDWENNGCTAQQLATQLVKIDYDLFADRNQTDWVGLVSDWENMLVAHPETWRVFVHNVGSHWEVLGYWMFVTPTDDWFARACIGEYPENLLTVDTTKSFEGKNDLYGPEIYCRSDIRGHSRDVLGSRLLLSFLYSFERLRHAGVEFNRVYIPVMSDEGRRLAEGRFDLERLPERISDHYAQQMNWPRTGLQGHQLPALYYGVVDIETLSRAGINS